MRALSGVALEQIAEIAVRIAVHMAQGFNIDIGLIVIQDILCDGSEIGLAVGIFADDVQPHIHQDLLDQHQHVAFEINLVSERLFRGCGNDVVEELRIGNGIGNMQFFRHLNIA